MISILLILFSTLSLTLVDFWQKHDRGDTLFTIPTYC